LESLAGRFDAVVSSSSGGILRRGIEVRSQTATALYITLMAALIVTVDVLFFRDRVWERLTVNVGIVLVFAAFYFRFLKRS
jgi:hypothetical protein